MCRDDENALHDLLGITDLRLRLRRVHAHQLEQEHQMASVLEALRQLADQQTAASAAQQTSFLNLQGALARLEEAVRSGEVSAEVQAAVNDLRDGFTAMTDAATRADDGYEPAPAEPGTPDTTGEVGAEPTPDMPAEPAEVTPGAEGAPVEPETTSTTRSSRRR